MKALHAIQVSRSLTRRSWSCMVDSASVESEPAFDSQPCRQYARGTGGVLADDMGLGNRASCPTARLAAACCVVADRCCRSSFEHNHSSSCSLLSLSALLCLQARRSRPLASSPRCWARRGAPKTPTHPRCR